jgi:hypothetical protein
LAEAAVMEVFEVLDENSFDGFRVDKQNAGRLDLKISNEWHLSTKLSAIKIGQLQQHHDRSHSYW